MLRVVGVVLRFLSGFICSMARFKFKLKNNHVFLGLTVVLGYLIWLRTSSSSVSDIQSLNPKRTLETFSANVLANYKSSNPLVNFNWYEVLNLSKFFQVYKPLVGSLNCEEFANRIGKTDRTYFNCLDDLDNKEIPLILEQSVNLYFQETERIIFAKIHLAKSLPNPSKLVYLFPDEKYLEIPVNADKHSPVNMKDMDLSKVLQNQPFRDAVKSKPPIVGQQFSPIDMPLDAFNYRTSVQKYQKEGLIVKTLNDKYATTKRARKYFGEAYVLNNIGKHELDWRFFNSSILLLDELELMSPHQIDAFTDKNKRYSQLIRTWEMFCYQQGIATWLSDIDLIGWRFNGLHLPMEAPNGNFQIAISDLLQIVDKGYNQSLLFNYYDDNIDKDMRFTGFLDISPYFKMRDRNNKENLVDIRLIDVETGLYISVFALTTFQYEKLFNFKSKSLLQSLKEVDLERIDKYVEIYKDDKTTLLNTKNLEVYNHNDLSPLLPVMYENYLAYVPHGYMKMLTTQYLDPFTATRWNFRFRDGINTWVPLTMCKLPPFVNNPTKEQDETCLSDPIVKHFYNAQKPATSFHETFLDWFNVYTGDEEYQFEPKHCQGFQL